jgi:TRAP-type uncharacterized transport system substrate-binding protein
MRVLRKWGAPAAGAAALAFALFVYFHAPRERTYHLRVTAGNALTTRSRLARLLQSEVASEGIDLELDETKGSEEALDRVNDHTLDVAMVQGGLQVSTRPHVRQIAVLQVEPLHLLVKEELLGAVSNHLSALAGKTLNVSEVGSGTHSLAPEVLAFAGIQAADGTDAPGYIPVEARREKLLAEKDRSRLPDAIMLIDPLPSDTARYLVTRQRYRLVGLPFGEAFALQSLVTTNSLPGGRQQGDVIDRGRICATSIPAYTYSVEPPVPAREVPTLGWRLLLVAHKDVDPLAIRKLVEAIYKTEFAKIVHPPLDGKLMDSPPEYPWHEGARIYRERNKPLVSGQVMDSTHKAFAILAAAASGLFVLWQWSKQRGQFIRDKGFNKYINQVTRIEEQAVQAEREGQLDPKKLAALREQLHALKTEALDRFTQGELAGKDLLAGFLAQANHAREYVIRLIERQGQS